MFKLQRLYDATAAETTQVQLKSQLLEFSNRISGQVDRMRRTRMQGVVEISLEPISNLKLNNLLERLIVIENVPDRSIQTRKLSNPPTNEPTNHTTNPQADHYLLLTLYFYSIFGICWHGICMPVLLYVCFLI